jgi:hypothetical protein
MHELAQGFIEVHRSDSNSGQEMGIDIAVTSWKKVSFIF